jgi:hypothetical protein
MHITLDKVTEKRLIALAQQVGISPDTLGKLFILDGVNAYESQTQELRSTLEQPVPDTDIQQ